VGGLAAILECVQVWRRAVYEAAKTRPKDEEGLEKCAEKVAAFFSQLTQTFAGVKFDPQGDLRSRLSQMYNFDFLRQCCRTSGWAPGEAEKCAALEMPPPVLAYMRSCLNATAGGWFNFSSSEHVAYKQL
jgi:hypothetical protein